MTGIDAYREAKELGQEVVRYHGAPSMDQTDRKVADLVCSGHADLLLQLPRLWSGGGSDDDDVGCGSHLRFYQSARCVLPQ